MLCPVMLCMTSLYSNWFAPISGLVRLSLMITVDDITHADAAALLQHKDTEGTM